jgi:predicted DCC family thiol-disulfide oxidoreductase YuxK
MSDVQREPYSYRRDPEVPPFPDDKPLFVFDGHCVLCSSGASWMMRKCGGKLRFASAQSPLGVALFRHYAIDPDKTYLLISDGESSGESTGYLKLCPVLGWPWRLLLIFGLIPEASARWSVQDHCPQPLPVVRQGRSVRSAYGRSEGANAEIKKGRLGMSQPPSSMWWPSRE